MDSSLSCSLSTTTELDTGVPNGVGLFIVATFQALNGEYVVASIGLVAGCVAATRNLSSLGSNSGTISMVPDVRSSLADCSCSS